MTTDPTTTPLANHQPNLQPDRLHPWVAALLALALLATWLLGYGPGSPNQLPWPALRALSAGASDAPTKSAASTGIVTAAAPPPAASAASSLASSPSSPSTSPTKSPPAPSGEFTGTAGAPALVAPSSSPGGIAGDGAATAIAAAPAAATAPSPDATTSSPPGQPLTALEARTLTTSPMAPVAVAQVFFPRANARLPKTVGRSLANVVKYLNANAAATVTVAGFHDSYGDPARNAELARRRAQAVAGVLERQGIDRQRIALQKPERSLGSGRAAQSRRVDVRVVAG